MKNVFRFELPDQLAVVFGIENVRFDESNMFLDSAEIVCRLPFAHGTDHDPVTAKPFARRRKTADMRNVGEGDLIRMFHQLDRARLTALNLPISSYYAGKRLSICVFKD